MVPAGLNTLGRGLGEQPTTRPAQQDQDSDMCTQRAASPFLFWLTAILIIQTNINMMTVISASRKYRIYMCIGNKLELYSDIRNQF